MSDLELTRDQATVLLLQKAVLDRLQELNDEARTEAAKRMKRSEARAGGDDFGMVRLDRGSGGPQKAKIVDRRAFETWVKLYHHDTGYEDSHEETTVVPGRVRPAYEAAILARVKKDGGLLDKATGEIEEVPGVERVDVPNVLKVLVNDDVIGPYVDHLLATSGLAPMLELERGSDDQDQ